jgi:hypothetical protein
MKLAILLLVPLLAAAQRAPGTPDEDMARIRLEPRPDKRARAALDNAEDALTAAREAYGKGDNTDVSARIEEVGQSVELADRSLQDTGKNPGRSPKHFKAAELRTRELLRKLEGFRDQMSVADRPVVERVVTAVQKIHDALLDGIMGKKK